MNLLEGCLLGLAVGDAAGAVLEFKCEVSEEDARRAMTMPGGGSLGVGPGQCTDDTELAVALWTVLKDSPGPLFPADKVAQAYQEWYASCPFDCGRTCCMAFGRPFGSSVGTAEDVMAGSSEFNARSQANGALMRIAPVAVWGVLKGLTYEEIAAAARQDAMLSHPSKQCVEANAVYSATLAWLLRNSGDVVGAFQMADKVCSVPDVVRWLHDEPDAKAYPHGGHVRHAFMLAFHHLRYGRSYEDAIRDTLMRGYDTDTNAAIVGAMIGALHGRSGIPAYMLDPVLAFDGERELEDTYEVRQPRPACYGPKAFLQKP